MKEITYKFLTVRKPGRYLLADILDREWDMDILLRLGTDVEDLCEQVAWMEDVRLVVLAFSGDIQVQQQAVGNDRAKMLRLVEPVAALKQPVIAVIRGDALGIGLELALACDIRIGTEGCRFGLPQVSEGAIPFNGGTQRLPRLIGPGRALEMILTGGAIDSDEALQTGILNRVAPPDSLMDSALAMAREMEAKSPLSTSFAKEALYSGMDLTLNQGISKELDLYLQLFGTTDRVEGISAFREKRTPEFKGE